MRRQVLVATSLCLMLTGCSFSLGNYNAQVGGDKSDKEIVAELETDVISTEISQELREEQERSGQSLSVYITQLLTDHYQKGDKTMEFTKTLAFQIPEELFNRIKDHLEREKQRTGRKLSQKDFVIGLIERALETAEQQAEEDQEEEDHADVG